jgi:hypothetical protein
VVPESAPRVFIDRLFVFGQLRKKIFILHVYEKKYLLTKTFLEKHFHFRVGSVEHRFKNKNFFK